MLGALERKVVRLKPVVVDPALENGNPAKFLRGKATPERSDNEGPIGGVPGEDFRTMRIREKCARS